MTDNQQPSSEQERKCRKCGETKPLTEFSKVYSQKSRGQQYRSHTCLVCHRQAHATRESSRRRANPDAYRAACRRHRNEHKETYQKRKRDWYAQVRATIFAHYGDHCACCGESEPSMLNIDHVKNDGAAQRKANKGMRWSGNLYAWIIDNGFPSDFQVLCYNCNLSKWKNGGTCAHQLREGSTTIPQGSRAKRPEAQSPHNGVKI